VLIVDDQSAFRRLARELLEADDFVVVGEAEDRSSAERAMRELRPDILVLDVRLGDENGIDVAHAARASAWPVQVVLTSTGDYAHAVEQCGAVGFIPKAAFSGGTLRAMIGPRP
jgi:two-component system nitrate/nitrite response regulator NarL